MLDATDNRLPYAPHSTFTEAPFKDELVEYYNVIAAENDRQEEELMAKVRKEDQSLKRVPYYMYYQGTNNNATAGVGGGDGASRGGSVDHAAMIGSSTQHHDPHNHGAAELVSNASITANPLFAKGTSLLQRAKQKVMDSIDDHGSSNNNGTTNNASSSSSPSAAGGGGVVGQLHSPNTAMDAFSSPPNTMMAFSMVVEEEEEEAGDAPPTAEELAKVDALVAQWSDEEKVKEAMTQLLRQLPAAYGDSATDIKCEKAIAAMIEQQKESKEVLDAAFRRELLHYQNGAEPAVPIMMATCDALDGSQGECRYTLRMLKRTRQHAANAVKLIALQRRRNTRRRLIGTMDSVQTWLHKTESVCGSILTKDYAVAAMTLGARLKPYHGKYFGNRHVVAAREEREREVALLAAAAEAEAQQAAAAAALHNGNSADPLTASILSTGSSSHPVSPSAGPSPSPSTGCHIPLSSPNLAASLSIGRQPPTLKAPTSAMALSTTSATTTTTTRTIIAPMIASPLADIDVRELDEYGLLSDEEGGGDEEGEEGKKGKRAKGVLASHHHHHQPLLSALEKVLLEYYTNVWDANDTMNEDMTFEDFLLGASAEVQSMSCGMAALGRYFALRQMAGRIIGVSLRDDVARLLTQPFDQPLLLNTLRGLHALHVRRDAIAQFFLELIDPILNDRFRAALCDVVGEDAGDTWEAVAKSLVPTELHPCTISLLASLADTLRNVMKLALACNTMVEEHQKCSTAFGTEAEGLTVYEGCKFLSGLTTRVIHKCFGAVVSYGSIANLRRGNVADCLHVYRLLNVFVHMCSGYIGDKSATATTGSLRFQWQAIYVDHFRANTLDEILKVMQSESFTPFPVTADDFQELRVLVEREVEEVSNAEVCNYLKLAPAMEHADTIQEHLAKDTAKNPFLNNKFMLPTYQPVEALTDRKAFSLFEDGHAVFTFSSFMACKYMIEAVNNAKGLATAAGDMLHAINGYCAMYIDFITTHFVAASEMVPLDTDPKVPAHIQSFFAIIRATSQQVASTCPSMVASGFPNLPHAVCMHWKARVKAPEHHYSLFERATAIASLETVGLCHRLCIQSLNGLLEVTELSVGADMSEAVISAAKFAVGHGFRQLSKCILSGDNLIAAIERTKWDSNVAMGVQQSGYTNTAMTDLEGVSTTMKALFKNTPPKGAVMLMKHCVFNTMLAFVEGISRVKKFGECGKAQVLTDALQLTQAVKDRFPSTSNKLVEYVLSFARAVMGQWQDVLSLVNLQHALYTQRQLMSFGEREGFMKKRELASIIEALGHVDKLPMFLIEE